MAIVIMYACSCFDYRRLGLSAGWLKSPASYLLVLSVALLILVLFPQFGTEINRARRWLRIPAGPIAISFQPSELAKWSIILVLAGFCDRFSAGMKLYWKRFALLCLIVALVVGLIIIEDFGTAAFVALLAFLMFIIAGVKWWYILTPLPFGAVAFFLTVIHSPSRMQRIAAFFNPQKWADSAAYQANQSLIALGSGGLLGKGLGRGICKYGHLPEDTTDFIFAIIGEELGLVGTATVIGLFIVFVWLGGIPLPFVSAGGTSMLLSAAAVGVLLNIAKQTAKD
jgi:cell division protein FtsW